MTRIKTSEIKDFFSRSKTIRTSTIIPVLSYIKLEVKDGAATLSKTNLESYCVHTIETESSTDESILLDERLLNAISATPGIIEIEKTETHIRLSNGSVKMAFPVMSPEHFPLFPAGEHGGETTTLYSDVLESIGIAKSYIKDNYETNLTFVHVLKNCVFATDALLLYYTSFESELPALCLRQEACNVVGGYETLTYFSHGNYDFFDTGRTIYGFIKNEYKAPNIEPLLKSASKDNFFEIKRADIVSFCELVNSTATEPVPEASFFVKDGAANFSYTDSSNQLKVENQYSVIGDAETQVFLFNPKVVLGKIKVLPYETLCFSQKENNSNFFTLWTNEDKNYTGLMVGMTKQ